jgi:hypothetical protein
VTAVRAAIIAMFVLLAGGSSASAVTPGFLGTGHDPGVAVDAAGTAHVAWLSSAPGATGVVHYCQVPRGRRACAARALVPVERDGFGKVQVLLPRPGTVQIIVPLAVATPLLTSTDNGATFSRADLGALPAIETALYGPGDAISIMSGSGPARVGRFASSGLGPGILPVEFGDALESLETTLAPLGPGLFAAFSGSGMRSVIWNGVGDPNLQQSWVEGPRPGSDRTSPAAMGGRSGTFLAYVDRRGGRSDIRVRRLSGTRLGRQRRISRDDPAALSSAEGPRGDLVVLWTRPSAAMYVRSRNGRRWTRPRRLFSGHDPGDLRAALGRTGGWVVWDGNPGNAGSHPIRIAAIPRAPRR